MRHVGFGWRRNPRPHRAVRAAGVATSMAAGALAMVMMVPRAVAESDPSGPLQSALDQLLEAEQQVVGINSQIGDQDPYSFITPYDLTRLDAYVQNLALTMFAISLGGQANDLAVRYGPYAWNAPAADPQAFITLANPDNLYSPLTVDPSQTYAVTVHPGPGTGDMTFTPNAGNGLTADYTFLPGGIDLTNATPNPDGTYTVILSSTQPPDTPAGNWVDIAGADRVIVRDSLGDWGLIHDDLSVQQVGVSATTSALPHLTDDQLASLLGTVATNLVPLNAAGTYFNTQRVFAELPANTFTPIKETISNVPTQGELGSLLPGQLSSAGHFVLGPDQALIVKVPDVNATYSGFEVADAWAQTAPYATVQGSLNNTQAFHEPDGSTYYVISSQDPGVANWVDNSGLADGEVYLRFINVTGAVPDTSIETHVVDVADVKNDIGTLLPADTPLVTAAERIADLQERLFEYDYALNQSHNIAWVGANLQIDQVKAALGADQFHQIFGGQTDVPSVLDRLTPALSPHLVTIGGDILAHPFGSLTAIVNNLPLALKDIELPAVLALLRLVGVVEQTAQAVQSDISSGHFLQVLTDLGTGVKGLVGVFDETWTDPATSITAGILNAPDDLAVAIMNASSATAPSDTLWNSLVEVNQALVQAVSNMLHPATTLAADFSTQIAADLAPNAGGLVSDLLP
ncbi:MAG TPA: DUF1214 domain-containing protein [Mycobacterium sp.]|nr:DUF1214 domain-containing protein [Mycobacterium sp.]